MLFSKSIIPIVSFTTAALAAPTCKRASTPTLPVTGSTDLPGPASNLTLKYVAVGHGIQNYTCTSSNATATAVNIGALAVLYDASPLYPGTPTTGLTTDAWDKLSSTVLRSQAMPLNLIDSAAGSPTANSTAADPYSESEYQADASEPFPSPAEDLSVSIAGRGVVSASFLGHHYFDALSAPTFNLCGGSSPPGLFFSGAKTGDVKAPAAADKGLLATGAVDWLELGDNGRGLSAGVTNVYRVVTAGGAAEACSVSGANTAGQVLSVPYAAQYWFYGP